MAQNAWWKVNTSLEAIALIREAWKDLNGDVEAPPLEPHAVENAPGALFVAQGASPAGAKKDDPTDIAHRILERVRDDKQAAALCVPLQLRHVRYDVTDLQLVCVAGACT